MNLNKHLITLSLIAFTASCGGGGSSSSKSDGLSQNACQVIGLEKSNTQRSQLQAKIITGTACQGTSPIVQLDIFDNFGSVAACTGTVITPNKVLTAAHCVVRQLSASPYQLKDRSVFFNNAVSKKINVPNAFYTDLQKLKNQFGDFLSDKGEINAGDVVNFIFSEGFNDVAVIEFDQNLNLPVAPIVFSRDIKNSGKISIFGYGLTDPNNIKSLSDLVRSGEMQVDLIGRSNIGAIFRSEGSNTCFGDSGGPAFVDSPKVGVVGVTSLGTNNCTEGELSIFTGLSSPEVMQFLSTTAPEANYN